MVFIFCLFLAFSPAAHANPGDEAGESTEYFPEDFPFAGEGVLQELEKVLSSPDFGSEKEGWTIRYKGSGESRDMPQINYAPWMQKIRRIFGFALRLFSVLVIASFAVFTLFWLWKIFVPGRRFRKAGKAHSGRLFPENERCALPESLFAQAGDFFYRGNIREAWAACLAGYIGAYARYRSLSFPADATEYACLDLLQKALPEEAGGFAELLQSWILLAYGGRIPQNGAFEQALAYSRAIGVSHEP